MSCYEIDTFFIRFLFMRIFCFLVIHPISSVILGVHLPSKSGKFEPTQFVLKSLLGKERPFSSAIDDETFSEVCKNKSETLHIP